ncbi:MAG: aspartate/glutamate racemase family protein [Qingshengfaniella sp.]
MKLLVINPNTSQFVTDRITAVARDALSPEDEVIGVTGQFGPRIVGTRSECAIAAQEALRLARQNAVGIDGILLGISFDTGLDALRQALPVPVIGMSEAGMLMALTTAQRFAMLTFGDHAVPLYRDLITHYGLDARSCGVFSLPPLSQAQMEDPRLVLSDLRDAIHHAARHDGAEAILLAGAIFAGLAPALRDITPIPVIDGITAGVGLLAVRHRLNLRPAAQSGQTADD